MRTNRNRKTLTAIVIGLSVLAALAAWQLGPFATRLLRAETADHDGHDDDKKADKHEKHDDDDDEKHDDDEKPDEHDEHAGDADHEDELIVKLSEKERRSVGIKLAEAGPGKIKMQIRVPGETVINADSMAHIVPLAPGVVRSVHKKVGDPVKPGEVMAMIESAELAEAKTDYLSKLNELACCDMDLTRAQRIHDNTAKLLELLDKSPSLDELRGAKLTEMGENRSKLVIAYAEVVFAKAAYEREVKLVRQKISSQGDFQVAESGYKKAHATYAATRDSVSFGTTKSFFEARRTRRNGEFAVKAAERKLYVLGLTAHDIASLRKAVTAVAGAGKKECTDPNCKDCKGQAGGAHAADGDLLGPKLGWYGLRSPFSGTVVQKHITLGEKLADDAGVFTVADLGTVWVNLSIYQKDLPHLAKGQGVHISAGRGSVEADGKIDYVSPMIDETTRTGLARVVLPNPKGRWRPGLFVSASVDVKESPVAVLVPKSAVQSLGDQRVVFVEEDDGFAVHDVKLGRSDATNVEIVSGLPAGARYVVRGGFALKAKIATSGLDAHAGHGH